MNWPRTENVNFLISLNDFNSLCIQEKNKEKQYFNVGE